MSRIRSHYLNVRQYLCIISLLLTSMVIPISVQASNDFGVGQWVINAQTATSGYYNTYIAQNDYYDGTPGTFTTGWMSVDLSVGTGTEFSAKFTQVGIQSGLDVYNNPAVHWFVYTEAYAPDIVCIIGIDIYYSDSHGVPHHQGCAGPSNELVHLQEWEDYALITDPNDSNHWYAAVVGHVNGQWQGGRAAYIPYNSPQIYNATDTAEEEYNASYYYDPLVPMSYAFYHPVYNASFNDWPTSPSNIEYSNGLRDPDALPYPYPNCLYGGVPNLYGDSRIWYYGTSGQYCGWTFSP